MLQFASHNLQWQFFNMAMNRKFRFLKSNNTTTVTEIGNLDQEQRKLGNH